MSPKKNCINKYLKDQNSDQSKNQNFINKLNLSNNSNLSLNGVHSSILNWYLKFKFIKLISFSFFVLVLRIKLYKQYYI